MRVRAQPDGLVPAHVIEDVRNVVIYDDFKQPILVAQTIDSGSIVVLRPGDPKFREVLTQMGVGLNAEYKVHKPCAAAAQL